jgi:hypothetical protein
MKMLRSRLIIAWFRLLKRIADVLYPKQTFMICIANRDLEYSDFEVSFGTKGAIVESHYYTGSIASSYFRNPAHYRYFVVLWAGAPRPVSVDAWKVTLVPYTPRLHDEVTVYVRTKQDTMNLRSRFALDQVWSHVRPKEGDQDWHTPEQIRDAAIARIANYKRTLRGIMNMATEQLRTDDGDGGAYWQIEADARGALEGSLVGLERGIEERHINTLVELFDQWYKRDNIDMTFKEWLAQRIATTSDEHWTDELLAALYAFWAAAGRDVQADED